MSLTDEQIYRIAGMHNTGRAGGDYEFARAIEAAVLAQQPEQPLCPDPAGCLREGCNQNRDGSPCKNFVEPEQPQDHLAVDGSTDVRGSAGRAIHGITMVRDSDGSFAVTMPDRWFAASPTNDAEDNIEGEVCMLLEHLWNAADLAGRDSEADAVRLYPRAMGYARTLAMDLHRLHFAQSAPMWQPCDDLLGLLTQIDNMAAGLALRVAHSREQDAPLVANTPGCNCPGEGKHEAHLHAPNFPYRNPISGREAPTVDKLIGPLLRDLEAFLYDANGGSELYDRLVAFRAADGYRIPGAAEIPTLQSYLDGGDAARAGERWLVEIARGVDTDFGRIERYNGHLGELGADNQTTVLWDGTTPRACYMVLRDDFNRSKLILWQRGDAFQLPPTGAAEGTKADQPKAADGAKD